MVLKGMNTSKEKKMLMEQKIQELLGKGAITCINHCKNKFVSNLLLREKNDGRYRPKINLKLLNQFLPYHCFKMEGLKQVKEVLNRGNLMAKLDLQDTYFSVPLHRESRKYV